MQNILEVKKTDSLQKYFPKSFKAKTVPDVIGMGVKEATYLLEKYGLKVNISGKGKVIGQSIQAGSDIAFGQSINLSLSNAVYDFKNTITSNTSPSLGNVSDSTKNETLSNSKQNIKPEITKEKITEKIKREK